jgi:hypothetical protein
MKFLVMALAFIAGPALACPADGSKDAAGPSDKTMAASTAKPAVQTRVAKQKPASTKVAVKSAAEAATKAAPL